MERSCDTAMDHLSGQSMTYNSTLFVLNNDCLMELFQRLELIDYVNLALAYPQLQNVVDDFSARKHTKISVICLHYDDCPNHELSSIQNFSTVLSVIGKHILEGTIAYSNKLILELIRENCKKLNSITLMSCQESPELPCLPELKEVHVVHSRMSNNEWRKCFTNNPNLQIVEHDDFDYNGGFLEMLTLLPKLKSLVLPWLCRSFNRDEEFDHLLCLDRLTKVTFRTHKISNEILIKLAKLKLVELEVRMAFNADSLRILNSFRYLEVLSIVHIKRSSELPWYSDATAFPPKLKSMKVQGMIPCSSFLPIVSHLKFLEQFEIWIGSIHWDNDESIGLKDANVISRIENELRQHQRTLKIIHWNDERNGSEYTYDSHHLKIINGWYTKNRETSGVGFAIRFEP